MSRTSVLKKMEQNQESLMLVDSADQVTGSIGKIDAHQGGGKLHRAFTVFLRNQKGEWFMTQRSAQKFLWPQWWDGACSSHPWFPDEKGKVAVVRRLPFEIGTDNSLLSKLHWSHSYEYHATYSDEWSENEINHIFVAEYSGLVIINPQEVAAFQWITSKQVDELLNQPEYFAPWFKQAWLAVREL